MSKLVQTTKTDIEVNTSTSMIVEIGELSFEVDERFPWINVYKTDDSRQPKEFIADIDEENQPIFVGSEEGFEEFKAYCLNWYFNNVEVVKDIVIKEDKEHEQN